MPNNTPSNPTYGTSQHYLGSAGEAYFSRQRLSGELSVRWNIHIWRPHITAGDDVLDFGCGGGALLDYLPGRVKVGVEINPAAREQAASRGLEMYASLDEVVAKEARFSRIISNHALEHVPSPYHALQSLRKLLAPDGKFILVLPLDDWRSGPQRRFQPDDPNHHLYAWTPQILGNLLMETGFQPEKIHVLTDCMPPVAVSFFLKMPFFCRSVVGMVCSALLRRRQLQAVAVSK